MMGGAVFDIEAGERSFPYHFHHGVEEWLYVISGEPVLRTPAGERALKPGDLVSFPSGSDGAHTVRGPGRILLLSAGTATAMSVYPDSDKLAPRPPEERDRLNFRRSDAVDYWEGE